MLWWVSQKKQISSKIISVSKDDQGGTLTRTRMTGGEIAPSPINIA